MKEGFSFDGLREFLGGLESINQDTGKEAALWLEGLGFQFLEEVQREIIRTKTVDTRRLLNSFDKGDKDNVWRITRGGLSLEIGTNLEYAKAVNDGHVTVKQDTPGAFTLADGTLARWVPGVWEGDSFTYVPGADTGMLLKEKFIEGTHYFDNAVKIWRAMFAKSLNKKFSAYIAMRMNKGGKAR